MTPEELRRLDALVHEKVMQLEPMLSWECLNEDESATYISFDTKREADEWLADYRKRGYPMADRHIGTWKHYPRYTETPVASKALRDKLAEKFIRIEVHRWGRTPPTICYCHLYASLEVDALDNPNFTGFAETEELAVALCALRSVGENPEVS